MLDTKPNEAYSIPVPSVRQSYMGFDPYGETGESDPRSQERHTKERRQEPHDPFEYEDREEKSTVQGDRDIVPSVSSISS